LAEVRELGVQVLGETPLQRLSVYGATEPTSWALWWKEPRLSGARGTLLHGVCYVASRREWKAMHNTALSGSVEDGGV
jgi:hypothetical protein